MSNIEEALYIVTNITSALAWTILALLVYLVRIRYQRQSIVFSWVRPFTLAFKVFCGISALRYLLNCLVIPWPVFGSIQAVLFVINSAALGIAVGYASVYYNHLPEFLSRIARHQINSRRFEAIADSAVDGMFEIDPLGNIWYANQAAADMFNGGSAKELLGTNISAFITIGPNPVAMLNSKHPKRLEMIKRNGETFVADYTISPCNYPNGGGVRLFIVLRDVSDKIELEKTAATSATG